MTEASPAATAGEAPEASHRRSFDVVRNFLWLSGGQVVEILLAVTVTLLMARYLGPERFGVLSYYVGFAVLFSSIARFGLDDIIVRELVTRPNAQASVLGTASVTKLLAGLVAAGCMMASLVIVGGNPGNAWLFGGILASGLAIQALDVPEMLFTSRTQSRYSVLSRSGSRIAMSLGRLVAIYVGASLLVFVSAVALEQLLIVTALVLVYRLQGNTVRHWHFDGALALRLVKQGLPLTISAVATLAMMRVDIVILEKYRGAAEVGIYTAAVRIADICAFVSTAVVTSFAPTLIATRARSAQRYDTYIAGLFQGLTVVMMVLSLVLMLSAGPLFTRLLGSAYAPAAEVLRIYIWATVFIALGVVQGQWLINEGYVMLLLYRALAGAAINLVVNFALIPLYGAHGAALAAVISQFASCVLINLFADRRSRHIFVLQAKALVWANLGQTYAVVKSYRSG